MAAEAVTIYHNPNCGTSRNVLALIRNTGAEPELIEYLVTPPTRARLLELIAQMNIPVRPAAAQGHAVRRIEPGQPRADRRATARCHDGAPHSHQSSDRGDLPWHAVVPAVRIRARYSCPAATGCTQQGRR